MYFYSKSQNAFFHDAAHGPRTMMVRDPAQDAPQEGQEDTRPMVEVQNGRIPGDAVEISDERHAELVEGIGNGHVLGAAEDGSPILLDIPAYDANFTPEEKMADIRAKRDRLLAASDWTQMPDVTMSVPDRNRWASYRQALRNFPDMPPGTDWPVPPGK